MDDDDRGWPLEKEAIRAKYYDLLQKDKVFQAHDPVLQKRSVHLSKSMSTREAFSRARSLRRVLQRAGWADPSSKGSRSLPVSSPSSASGATFSFRRSRLKNCGILSQEVVLAPLVNEPKLATAKVKKSGTQTKFLAKQFKLITNSANAPPRRNINILAKDPSEATKVMVVAEEIESDRLQERVRVLDSDQSDPSNLAALSLTLDSLSRSSGPRKLRSSYYGGHAHANSPSSVISDVSVPETLISSVDNEWVHQKLTSFSFTRERWTSRELFGSFDFGGELDIAASVTEATLPNSSGYFDHDRLNSCSDKSLSPSPSSGMRSPRQSLCTSSQGEDDHHYYRCRGESCGDRATQRVKVTSPTSLFRDGPWTYKTGDKPQSSPLMPRKLSRKVSTSFNKRRKQTKTTVQPHPESLSKSRSPGKDEESSSEGNWALQIAGLVSAYRSTSKAGDCGGNGAMREAAATAFQDEIAQLMLDRSESNEIGDIEEFLEGYMRLRSPIFLDVVEEFFRTVSYDCYKQPREGKKAAAPKVLKVPLPRLYAIN